MTRKELESLAEKYQAKADRAFTNYQQTGISRYSREYRNNEDLACAIRMAARAADDSNALTGLRVTLSTLADKARMLKRSAMLGEDIDAFLNEVILQAKIRDLIREE